jgi:exopolysaccharide biosynthesis polyprenyl glycosylphosphotransferase
MSKKAIGCGFFRISIAVVSADSMRVFVIDLWNERRYGLQRPTRPLRQTPQGEREAGTRHRKSREAGGGYAQADGRGQGSPTCIDNGPRNYEGQPVLPLSGKEATPMSRTRMIQQASSAPVAQRTALLRPPSPQSAPPARFHGLLQMLLEGPGWRVVRPAVDFVALSAGVVLALGGLSVSDEQAPLLALPALTMVLFLLRGLYRTRLRALVLDGVVPVLSAVSVAAMTVAMIGVLANGRLPGQEVWVRAWLYALVGVGLGRIALVNAQRLTRAKRLIGRPVLIVGAGIVGAQVARRLEAHPEYGLLPIGFIDDDPRSTAEVGGRDVEVLGTLEDVDRIVERTKVDHLIVAFSSVADARISQLVQHCQELGLEVSVVPRMFDTMNHRAGYEAVGGLPLLSFSMVDPKGWQFAFKYAMDRVLAAGMLLVLSPVLLALALAVRLSSPGPVLFRQRRVGRDGTEFDLLKFRSMSWTPATIHGQDEDNVIVMLPSDTAPGGVEGGVDRRTAVGRLMRRTSLDELPQLINVMRGEMSLIGPRPERPEFVQLFDQDVARYRDRHRVKSGITGWAQVHGLRGKTSLAERVEWDNYYISHWSLALDLKILLLTLAAVFHNAE